MPTIAYERPPLVEYQERAVFNPSRIAVIEASTKSGKTHACLVWLIEQAALYGKEGDIFWWLAPSQQQAKMAFDDALRGVDYEFGKGNKTEKTLHLSSGATIKFLTADNPNLLYGFSVKAAVVDEGSRVSEDSWEALQSTLTATDGPVRIIGNVEGRKNWMFRLARQAEEYVQQHPKMVFNRLPSGGVWTEISDDVEKPLFSYARITAKDALACRLIDERVVEEKKLTMSPRRFRALYYCEPGDDGGNPFGFDAIEECIEEQSNLPPACFGVDLARKQDYTAVVGLDENGAVCRFYHWQMDWPSAVRRIVQIIGHTPAYVDSTGAGDPIFQFIEEEAGARNFMRYNFSPKSKQQLMEGLAIAIQGKDIRFPEGRIVDELKAFQYEERGTHTYYSAPSGQHDDCVIALGLAVACQRVAERKRMRQRAAGVGPPTGLKKTAGNFSGGVASAPGGLKKEGHGF